jgi:hypothetical protein
MRQSYLRQTTTTHRIHPRQKSVKNDQRDISKSASKEVQNSPQCKRLERARTSALWVSVEKIARVPGNENQQVHRRVGVATTYYGQAMGVTTPSVLL